MCCYYLFMLNLQDKAPIPWGDKTENDINRFLTFPFLRNHTKSEGLRAWRVSHCRGRILMSTNHLSLHITYYHVYLVCLSEKKTHQVFKPNLQRAKIHFKYQILHDAHSHIISMPPIYKVYFKYINKHGNNNGSSIWTNIHIFDNIFFYPLQT